MKKVIYFSSMLLITTFLFQCAEDDHVPDLNKKIPSQWADVTLYIIKNSPSNSPTYASRCLGYLGLTMYECVVHGSNSSLSLAGQLNGLNELPLPESAEYNWSLVLNSGQAYMLRKLYPHTLVADTINAIETMIYKNELASTSIEVANRSTNYGIAIASEIYNWSTMDGGNEGYLHNFDPGYVFPEGEGYWIPPVGGQSSSPYPLHPYWGNNRTFVPSNATISIPVMEPRSTDPTSTYYNYYLEVYEKRNSLTDEEKKIAAWWADDPSQTASPPGHSYNLATILITLNDSDLFAASEIYAKVGLAVADAFINCWKCKYHYHSERPFPFISSQIDNTYTPFWPEPPFPAFSSGHSTQSAAAAIVLMSMFNDNTTFIDDTYASRPPSFENISYKSRTFNTIWSTAEECAYSRFLGGIHTRHDNEAGINQGKIIGENVVALDWKK